MKLNTTLLRLLLVLPVLLIAAACGEDPQPAEIRLSRASLEFDAVGETAQLTARVFDAGGVEIAVPVEWSSSNSQVATVNSSGVVTSVAQGTATIQATAGTVAAGVGTTVAIFVADLVALTSTDREGIAGEAFAEPLRVRALDRGDSPAAGVTINASVSFGGGSLADTVLVTDANGEAETVWTLGPTAGELQQVRLRSATSSASVFFVSNTVAGPPTILELLQGGDQVGLVDSELPIDLVVRLTDQAGNPITASTISFGVTSGNGSLSVTEADPSSEGEAASTWTLGPDAGNQSVTISAADLTTVVSATALTAPAALSVVSGGTVSGTVGQVVADPIQVRVEDLDGAGIPDVPVRFTPLEGSGSVLDDTQNPVSTTVAVTDAEGIAQAPSWVLGTVAGPQTLVASFPGLTPVPVSATAAPGAVANVTIASGDYQTAENTQPLSDPVVFELRDAFDNLVPGATVDFAASGTGTPSAAQLVSDAAGEVSVGWTLGAELGLQTLFATPQGSAVTAAAYAAGLRPVTGDFEIEVVFGLNATPSVWAAFQLARNRWSQLIVGDLPDVEFNLDAGSCGGRIREPVQRIVDDLTVYAYVEEIDGPFNIIGQALACFSRSGSFLPAVGYMAFDAADLERIEQQGSLENLILHEMGHTLGLSRFTWSNLGLIEAQTLSTREDTHFTGLQALAAFDAVGGDQYTAGQKVPLENAFPLGNTGSNNSHWREGVFDTELMSPTLDGGPNPISTVTVGALEDMGYVVDYVPADVYTLPGTAPPTAAQLLGGDEGLLLIDDVIPVPPVIIPESWIIRR